MAIQGGYAPPGVYTSTTLETLNQTQPTIRGRVPTLIGTGRQTVENKGVALVRGSSATIDQRIVGEDPTGRMVSGQNPDGSYNLTEFDGSLTQLKVRHLPVVSGDGSGTITNNPSSVVATINGNAVVVLAVNGTDGIITLAEAPAQGDDVRVSYYFNRMDTLVENEDVSSQVSTSISELYASSGTFVITSTTNTLSISADGVSGVVTLPQATAAERAVSIQRVVAQINDAGIGSLEADTYTDSNGEENLYLTANGSITIGNGTANQALGLFQGMTGSTRTRTFFTANGPIVDGSNSGVVTTDVNLVSVRVNGNLVTPVSVDGANNSVTLAEAPVVGSSVTITYYHNTFRNQFDYLPGSNIRSIDRVALTYGSGGLSGVYTQGVDFILQDDKIIWGTAASSSAGLVQNGEVTFGSTQVAVGLRDERAYNLECTRVLNANGSVVTNKVQLPFVPVDGTGTGTATKNPAMVTAISGVSLADALESNSPLTITRVETNGQVTFAESVPSNHKVFATFYYSNIQDNFNDNAYTLEVLSVGASGTGTYSVSTPARTLYNVSYEGKGTDLTEIAISFPSGSEANPEVRVSGGSPVEENVTLQIENFAETPAILFAEGSETYFPVSGSSSDLQASIDNQAITVDFDSPMGSGRLSSVANLVGDVIPYDPVSNGTNYGNTATTRSMNLTIDGVAFNPVQINQVGDDVDSWVSEINAEASVNVPTYTAMGQFSSWEAKNNTYKSFKFSYKGDVNGRSIVATVTLTEAVYLTPSNLASEVTDRLADAVATIVAADADMNGLTISCEADNDGRLVFSLDSLPLANDAYGFIEFIADDDTSFLTLAGVDYDSEARTLVDNGDQTKWGYLPVAAKSRTTLSTGELRDRLILKNRTLMGNNYYAPVELGVEVNSGVLLSDAGFTSGDVARAHRSAVIDSPTLVLTLGWTEVDASGIPAKTLYDGTGAEDANDTLVFEIDGTTVNIPLTSSNNGTLVPITGVLSDINFALTNAGLLAEGHIEGATIRIVVSSANLSSYIKVGAGLANDTFQIVEGATSSAQGVSAQAMVSALMSHSVAGGSFDTALFSEQPATISAAGFFTEKAIAFVATEVGTGRHYLGMESLSAGNSSVINITGGGVLRRGVGLRLTTDSIATGEAAYQGFFVTSDSLNGSGSANTSVLNDGIGADGVIGQTYVDDVTGLTINLLPRTNGLGYPTGANATLSFKVGATFTSDANIPVVAIPGVSMIVSNTTGTAVGDTAVVESFLSNDQEKEPNLGQTYYVDYTIDRNLYNTRVFTNLNDVIKTYGPISPENSLSLGAYLAFINGAVSVACKQVQLASGQTTLTEEQVLQAIQDIEGEIQPGLSPSVITPLVPMTSTILAELSNHCDLQSSLRYRSERRAVVGVASGTQPREVQNLARAVGNSRVCIVYPDLAYVSFTDEVGVNQRYLVGGEFVAVAVANATSNTSLDAATPWTGRVINGFSALARNLDEVDANATANAGVTVLHQSVDGIKVRHGLTTNMSSILTKTPTVVQIADHVQVRARTLLERYIGVKYVPQTVQQIEGRVNAFFKQLVRDQIISTYTGLNVSRDANDPTQLNIEVFYKPVYPLLYIQFSFTIQGG